VWVNGGEAQSAAEVFNFEPAFEHQSENWSVHSIPTMAIHTGLVNVQPETITLRKRVDLRSVVGRMALCTSVDRFGAHQVAVNAILPRDFVRLETWRWDCVRVIGLHPGVVVFDLSMASPAVFRAVFGRMDVN